MTQPLLIRVRAALAAVANPVTGRNIVADGLVHGLSADKDGKVSFTLEIDENTASKAESLLSAAKAAASAVAGVSVVSAVATAHRPAAASAQSSHDNPFGLKKKPQTEEAGDALGEVGHIIAIASGKGGVGKSTITANLAVALVRRGLRVGLLDADVYGPSVPTLFGVSGKAELRDGKLVPVEACGVKLMSIGMLVDPEQALAWRGPMVMGALKQLMRDVDWGALDMMLVDTPPGTGDVHLSLVQSKKLSGAVIVSTPQEMALADVRRGVSLFRKTQTPIVGVIENMAWLEAPDGSRQFLFGEGGAKRAAEDLGAPFLGAAPLIPDLRAASDQGAPLAGGDHPAAKIFADLAEKITAFTAQP